MALFYEAAANFDEDAQPLLDLIGSGQNLEQADRDGMTLLHHACEQGHADAVVALVEAGAALEAQTREGRTALHVACIFANDPEARGTGHVACCHYLQQCGAATGTQDAYGRTALSYLPIDYKRVGLDTCAARPRSHRTSAASGPRC